MPEVIQPTEFNERFTLYLNAEGKPVQRTLREMTADEVMLAIQWAHTETDQLHEESKVANAIAEPIMAKGYADPPLVNESDLSAVDASRVACERARDAADRTRG